MPDTLARFAANDEQRRHKLIGGLRDGRGPAVHRLADILAKCRPNRPCRSPACPLCAREAQRCTFSLIEATIRRPARELQRNRMTMLTVVPAAGIIAPEELTAEACRAVAAEIRAGIAAVGLPAVGTLEVSFNEDATGKVEPHWCAHGHPILPNWLDDRQRDLLSERFPRVELGRRPIDIRELDQRENAPLYANKSDHVRRVSYLDTSNPNRKPYRNTRRRELRPEQAAMLALVEHRLGFLNRLITNRISKNAIGAAFEGFYDARDGP